MTSFVVSKNKVDKKISKTLPRPLIHWLANEYTGPQSYIYKLQFDLTVY